MTRSRWAFLALAVLLGGGLVAAFLGPRGPEEFPLAELVPADALAYAGFSDLGRFEELAARFPGLLGDEERRRLEEARPHLAGPLAFYVDSKREWVGLARLSRGAALLAGAEVQGDAAVFAQTPAALERHRARSGSLAELPAFRRLGATFFVNLEALELPGPPSDFAAAGFRLEPGEPLALRGRALYRPDRLRVHLERYVQSPHEAGTDPAGPSVQLAMTDPFLRLWDDTIESLEAADRDTVDRELQLLRRDVTGGRDPREVLGTFGPRWGIAVSPGPALTAWLELPDAATADLLGRIIERAVQDAERLARRQGKAPTLELEKTDAATRIRLTWAAAIRGVPFTPAFTITKNRLVVSTSIDALQAAPAAKGESHAELSIRVAPALELARALTPYLSDQSFRPEAERIAWARHLKEFGPLSLNSPALRIADPIERERFLATKKAEFTADALAELSKTDRYKDELARRERSIATLTQRLSGFDRLSATGVFTGDGLEFTLRTYRLK